MFRGVVGKAFHSVESAHTHSVTVRSRLTRGTPVCLRKAQVVYRSFLDAKFGKFLELILIGRNVKWSVLIGRALFAARGATV